MMAERSEDSVRKELAASPTAARREHLEALLPQDEAAEDQPQEDE